MVLNKNITCCTELQRIVSDKRFPVKVLDDSNSVGLMWKVNGFATMLFSFCPWCGKEFNQSMDNVIDFNIWTKRINKEDLRSYKDKLNWWNERKKERLADHGIYRDLREDIEEDVPFVYHPIIRTFGILRKKTFSTKIYDMSEEEFMEMKRHIDFYPINYCYICGQILPKRLDKQLTTILRKEYGLNSWRDYKKAPPEFQTDEWWKKRGL